MTLSIATYPDTRQEQAFQKATLEAEHDLLPPHDINQVFKLYGVPASQWFEIIRYFSMYPDLAQVLVKAVPHIQEVFGQAPRDLELDQDPDGGGEELFGVILVKSEAEEALELLRRFDEIWFSEASKHTHNYLNFTVDIQDDDPV